MRIRNRLTAGIVATVLTTLALVAPSAPASAGVRYPHCEGVTGERCVELWFNDDHGVRAVGSLRDDTWGNDTVAVVAYLEVLRLTPQGRWYWKVIAESPRAEANNYVLTATAWKQCRSETYRARVNWNYKRGQNTGTITTGHYPVDGC
jgi:hypothetical protein